MDVLSCLYASVLASTGLRLTHLVTRGARSEVHFEQLPELVKTVLNATVDAQEKSEPLEATPK